MGKLLPQERWQRHVMERFTALKQSGELEKLRAKGLAILGRQDMFTAEEWNQTFTQRATSQEYLAWHNECKTLGERFGLAPWVVARACLQKGYQPEAEPYVIEVEWPQVRVVTESTDPLVLARLAYEAQGLGLYVVQRHGSSETTCIVTVTAMVEPPPLPPSKPPPHRAFHIRAETPIGYPPEAASELQKEAGRLGQELLKRLGYTVPKRMRTSSLVSLAEGLKAGEGPLRSGGSYDIIDEVYEDGDLSLDQQRLKTIESRRHRLRKRLVEPYNPGTEVSHNARREEPRVTQPGEVP